LKEEALDRTVWRIHFGRSHGAVWRLWWWRRWCQAQQQLGACELFNDRHTAINVCDCGCTVTCHFCM